MEHPPQYGGKNYRKAAAQQAEKIEIPQQSLIPILAVLDQANVVQGVANHSGADVRQARHCQQRTIVGIAEPGCQHREYHDLTSEGVDHRSQNADDKIPGYASEATIGYRGSGIILQMETRNLHVVSPLNWIALYPE